MEKQLLQLIADNQKRIENNLDVYMKETRVELKEIRQQTQKTNGSVADIKFKQDACPINDIVRQTEFLRFFSSNWKFTIFVIVLILLVCSVYGINSFINLIK